MGFLFVFKSILWSSYISSNANITSIFSLTEFMGEFVMNDIATLPKQSILLAELSLLGVIDKAIIESLEQALYRLEIEAGGQVYYVNEAVGKPLSRRSIIELQSLLTAYTIRKMYLRHTSPYDEMIGHEVNSSGNELLVPLGNFFADIEIDKNHSSYH